MANENQPIGGDFALFGPEMRQNPYPFYHRLRAADPVMWNDRVSAWVLTRYADVNAILRDSRASSERSARLRTLPPEFEPIVSSQTNSMLSSDPPKHTRLRGLVSKAFTPRAVAAMRPFVQQFVDRAFDAVEAKGQMDVMADLAWTLPVAVIAEMLGVAEEDRGRFKQWSDDATVLFSNVQANMTREENRRALDGYLQLKDYFLGVVEQLRKEPRETLLGAMVAAQEQGDRLDEAELFANSILLLNAGHETTTNLIGNGTLALLTHPDQWQVLRDDPSKVPHAVEELLRFDSPVQFTSRSAIEDMEVGGKAIRKGQFMNLLLGAANRDPEAFPEPDRLDVTRPEIHHVAFGVGPHYCLGAPLARLEGEIVFSTMIRRFPDLTLAEESPRYRANFNLRGLESLRVSF